jgi:NH3-dependent NAD+ synthetase
MTISARPPTPASWRKDQHAHDAVEAEREELDTFLAAIKVSEVGKDASIRGKNAKLPKQRLKSTGRDCRQHTRRLPTAPAILSSDSNGSRSEVEDG